MGESPHNRGNPAPQRLGLRDRRSYASPPARYGITIWQTRGNPGTQSQEAKAYAYEYAGAMPVRLPGIQYLL